MDYILFLSHRVYDAYLSHRQKGRSSSPGGGRRIYPAFRTSGNRIVPPEDVPSSSEPIFNNDNLKWSGRDVTCMKRTGDLNYYLGMYNL